MKRTREEIDLLVEAEWNRVWYDRIACGYGHRADEDAGVAAAALRKALNDENRRKA